MFLDGVGPVLFNRDIVTWWWSWASPFYLSSGSPVVVDLLLLILSMQTLLKWHPHHLPTQHIANCVFVKLIGGGQ